jgi:hypothetical protein
MSGIRDDHQHATVSQQCGCLLQRRERAGGPRDNAFVSAREITEIEQNRFHPAMGFSGEDLSQSIVTGPEKFGLVARLCQSSCLFLIGFSLNFKAKNATAAADDAGQEGGVVAVTHGSINDPVPCADETL